MAFWGKETFILSLEMNSLIGKTSYMTNSYYSKKMRIPLSVIGVEKWGINFSRGYPGSKYLKWPLENGEVKCAKGLLCTRQCAS